MEYNSKNVLQIQTTKAINEYEKGNKEIAIKLLKQTVLDHPDNSTAQNNLACMLWDVGLHWEALFIIKKRCTRIL
jgi:Flp pilus assembly protein TadD